MATSAVLFCKANEMIPPPPWLVLFSSAELIFLLMRKRDIEILLKTKSQRESKEQYQVERGLLRSVFLEGILFAPASAALMLPFAPLVFTWLESWLATLPQGSIIVYAGMGMVSYQFPFAALQKLITQRALKALNKFSGLAPPEQKQHEQELDEQDKQQDEANGNGSG